MNPEADAAESIVADAPGGEGIGPDQACGCAPPPGSSIVASDGASVTAQAVDSSAPAAGVDASPRELKLVIILAPAPNGERAPLAAGAAGCDPELRAVDVPDLAAALVALGEVTAAAEARWRVHHRYPPAPRPEAQPRQRPVATTARSPIRTDGVPNSSGGSQPLQVTTAPASPDQLSLFS